MRIHINGDTSYYTVSKYWWLTFHACIAIWFFVCQYLRRQSGVFLTELFLFLAIRHHHHRNPATSHQEIYSRRKLKPWCKELVHSTQGAKRQYCWCITVLYHAPVFNVSACCVLHFDFLYVFLCLFAFALCFCFLYLLIYIAVFCSCFLYLPLVCCRVYFYFLYLIFSLLLCVLFTCQSHHHAWHSI